MYALTMKILIFILTLTIINISLVANSNPPVKKSNSGICHPLGGTYYDRTKSFKPYPSMEACIQSGGRAPKR